MEIKEARKQGFVNGKSTQKSETTDNNSESNSDNEEIRDEEDENGMSIIIDENDEKIVDLSDASDDNDF